MEKEAKKEAFRKYLDSSGVLDAMTKVLVALYEKNDNPASAVDFIQNKLGGPTLSDYEKLQAEKADLQIKYAELLAAHQDTCRELAAVTSLLGSGSQPASSAGLFGSSSQPASRACLFGSQPATSTGSTFGLKPGASPVFGVGCGSSTSPSSGFSFSSSGNGALAFGSTSTGVSSGSSMFFNSSTTSSGSFPALSSVFSMSSQPVSFGSTTIQNDQMNVEDSMAEDTVQASNGIPNPFGQVANAPSPNTSPFVFGSPAVPPGAPVFQFGGHQNAPSSQPPSLFSPPGGAPTGSFSLGTGGPDKSSRRIVKVRRDKPRKK